MKGDTAEAALRKLRNTYNLMELSQRPMLLDMIVRSLDRITTDEINAATLYQIYTDAWIHRDQWRDILSPEAKLALLTALGRTLWTQDMVSIHYSQLAEYLQSELATQIQNVHHFVEIDSEVRTATFLTRDDQGNYGFAHKSYSEYFVARHIAGELSHQRTGVLSTRRLSPEIIGFLRYMVDREAVESILENLLRSEYRPIISENAVLCLYGFRRGALLETSTDDTSLETRLIVEMPEGLRLCGAQFDQVSLEGACLRNANLAGANLSEATLAGIDLSGSDVSSASFDKAVLSHALLRGCNCRDAVFSGADLEHAVLEGSDFSRADLSDAYLASADCTGITWTEAKLVGAILPNGLDASVTEYWDIVESLRPWMLEMVQSQVTPEEVDEEDVVSDVVMALVQPRYIDRVITLEDRDRRSFVASVMINVLAAHRRMARREISFDLVDHAAVEASLEAAYSSYSPGHSFEERLSVDSSRLFERLAELLAHDTYKIVSLRFESNLGIAKIAEIMGISTRTVQRHLRKAGEIARKQLLLPPI